MVLDARTGATSLKCGFYSVGNLSVLAPSCAVGTDKQAQCCAGEGFKPGGLSPRLRARMLEVTEGLSPRLHALVLEVTHKISLQTSILQGRIAGLGVPSLLENGIFVCSVSESTDIEARQARAGRA